MMESVGVFAACRRAMLAANLRSNHSSCAAGERDCTSGATVARTGGMVISPGSDALDQADSRPHQSGQRWRIPSPGAQPRLQSDALRVQAVLTNILHDAGHPCRVRIVDNMNQVGRVQAMAYRDHASFMPDFVLDGLEGALVKGFVNMHEEISGLHEALLVTVAQACTTRRATCMK